MRARHTVCGWGRGQRTAALRQGNLSSRCYKQTRPVALPRLPPPFYTGRLALPPTDARRTHACTVRREARSAVRGTCDQRETCALQGEKAASAVRLLNWYAQGSACLQQHALPLLWRHRVRACAAHLRYCPALSLFILPLFARDSPLLRTPQRSAGARTSPPRLTRRASAPLSRRRRVRCSLSWHPTPSRATRARPQPAAPRLRWRRRRRRARRICCASSRMRSR